MAISGVIDRGIAPQDDAVVGPPDRKAKAGTGTQHGGKAASRPGQKGATEPRRQVDMRSKLYLLNASSRSLLHAGAGNLPDTCGARRSETYPFRPVITMRATGRNCGLDGTKARPTIHVPSISRTGDRLSWSACVVQAMRMPGGRSIARSRPAV